MSQFLPSEPCLQHLINCLTKDPLPPNPKQLLLTGLSLCLKNPMLPASARNHFTTQILDQFEESLDADDSTACLESKIVSQLCVLMLIENCLKHKRYSQDDGDLASLHDIMICDCSDPDDVIKQFNHQTSDDLDSAVVERLMNLNKVLMNKLTIDDWLETAEMSCSKLMKTTAKAGVSLWSDTMIPSNLQMMISHHQFTAHDIIKVNNDIYKLKFTIVLFIKESSSCQAVIIGLRCSSDSLLNSQEVREECGAGPGQLESGRYFLQAWIR